MRAIILILLTIGLASSILAVPPLTYRMQSESPDYRVHSLGSGGAGRLLSNSIIDQRVDSLRNGFWFATGSGVNFWNVTDSSWINAVSGEKIGKGGVSAIVPVSRAVWAATAFDTTIQGQSYPAGGGIGYTIDNGDHWIWMPQPVDRRDETTYHPTTTNIQNITYDLAVTNRAVWSASFGGGLRRFTFSDSAWHVRPPDNNPFWALQYLNHRAFSVTAINDTTIWVGTAGGVNVTTDDGSTWQNFHFSATDTLTISGNFVVALHNQITRSGRTILWAATWMAEDPNEEYGVSWTDNGGLTWHRTLLGEKIHNLVSDDSVMYAVGTSGIFKTADYGVNWYLFPSIRDQRGIDRFVDSELYSVAVGYGRLSIGGPDGWAISNNRGLAWTIGRVFISTSQGGQPPVYAYPNPFSPQRTGAIRIQYHLSTPGNVTITIYNFALEKAGTVVKNVGRPAGDNFELWDGHFGGSVVANGVYFFRVQKPGGDGWGKIAIVD